MGQSENTVPLLPKGICSISEQILIVIILR